MSVYLSISKQCIIDPIQNSILVPILNLFTTHSIQTLLLLPIILPIFNHFTTNPVKTLLLLPILNLWIIDPLQNYIILPIMNHFTTDRIQNNIILPILDLLPTHPIKKFLLLPIIGFIGKQIKDHLLKFFFNHLLKCVFVPIKPHICYPFKCDSYVKKLKKQTEKLKEKRDSLEQSVFEADEVTKWLSSANNEINEAKALIQSKKEAKTKKCLFGLCPNFKRRYQLSKEADKKASSIDKLWNQEGFVLFSSRPPLQQIVEPSVYSREALPSRVLIINQVMDALKDNNLYMIGVYGLGGVGKTTLAKEVQRKAVEEKMFKRVVMVLISQTPDLRKIQEEIADFVDLKFDAQGVAGRASELKERLEKSKVLIILDDIWTEFELNAVGIPIEDECKGSKLLLTSRSHDVLSCEMGTQKEFSLEVLGEEETWKLFQKTLEDANNPELQAIAIKVSKKCSGLPLLVNIVAADLKNKELSAWRDTLVKLSDLDNEEIHGKVHKVLKSSYENLHSNDAKSLFILCSFFGQSNIPINHLLTYAMGLGLFKNIFGVKVARDRLYVTIEKLKTESWLLDGDMNGYVKMHDVVLDFARSIAIKDEHAFFGINGNGLRQLWPADENCTRIVLHHCDISELSEGIEYPNAELLSLFTKDLNLVIPDLFFKGISKLKLLNLTGMCLMPLPSSLQFLTSLHSLYMHQCRLKDVAIIGDLKQLEFLSFEESHIVELPRQLGKLTQLKSLNLTKCSYLKVIPPNVLPKLSLLEELYIESFDEWELNGNASLMELEELRQLTTLEVRVSRPKELPSQLFSKELERYIISLGKWDDYWWNEDWWTYKGPRTLKLRLETSIHLEHGLKELLRESGGLCLGEIKGMENGLYDLNEEGFPKLKHLYIEDNKPIRHIIDSTMWVSCDAFPILETLILEYLHSLEEISRGRLGTGSFRKLRILRIIGCGKLKKLFSFSTAKNLSQLQEIYVHNCENLEAVIAEGSEDGICNPRKMSSETQTEMAIFPNLQKMDVSDMDNLEYIWHGQLTDDDSFYKLKSLKIRKCSKLKSLFATSKNVMRIFQRLEKLKLWSCDKMEEIYQMEELGSVDEVAFQLRHLKIELMPSLKRIWSEDANGVFNFPNLTSVQVFSCNVLEYVFPESIASGLLQLEKLKVERCKMEHVVGNRKSGGPYNLKRPKLKHFKLIDNSQKANQRLPWLAKVSFPNLTRLEVEKCNSLKYIFKTSTLKSLKTKDCELIEERILTEEFEEEEERTDKIVFSKLDFLELTGLPNLITFSNSYSIESQSLREMIISDCPRLKNFVTDISNKNSSNDVRSLFNEMAIFPNLQTMHVSSMDNLEYIWHGQFADDDCLCKLKSLRINWCSKLKAVFAISKNVMRRFQRLEELELEGCDKMEMIYQMEELGSIDEVPFELRHLKIQFMPSLKRIWSEDANGVLTFPNLKSVEVFWCDDLEYIFPESIASGILQLEELKVESCNIEYVVGNTKGGEPYNFKWPKLKHFRLKDNSQKLNQVLPCLAKIAMPSLEELMIDWDLIKCIFNGNNQPNFLSKLKAFVLWGFHGECGVFPLKSFPNMEALSLIDSLVEEIIPELNVIKDKHLGDTNDLQTASIFQNLKRFGVCEYHRLKILMPSSVCFKNLTYMEVSKCDEMINLITVSTAESLVLLRTMIISKCKMMQEIVRVESDGSKDVIGFNQLRCLKLHGLPSLICFCSSNYAFHFQNLDDVTITKCPNLKTFSQQLLMPKHSRVETSDYWGWKCQGSLHNTIQKLFMDGQNEKDEDTKMNDDDDDDDDEADPEETGEGKNEKKDEEAYVKQRDETEAEETNEEKDGEGRRKKRRKIS